MITYSPKALLATAALSLTFLFPTLAYAEPQELPALYPDQTTLTEDTRTYSAMTETTVPALEQKLEEVSMQTSQIMQEAESQRQQEALAAAERTTKLLPVNRDLINAIGTQASTGHTICCPGFACAYGDSIITGTAIPHEEYGCGMCVWTNWGGGGSSNRSLGSDGALLQEAYEQILQGKPTVIHVTGPTAEHWITLIGYENVSDSSQLTLSNFTALDPWDGAQINAGSVYSLYGDNCEHISSR